ADVDAVIVATPHYSHPPLTVKALNKGINVISEKPAGVYTKQVKEMNAVAAKSGKLFTIMFNQRTNPLYKKMREIVLSGGIGVIKRINWLITNWYRTQFYYDSGAWRATWEGEGGGVLFNQCPHQLDLLSWITGMMPSKIRAFCHFGKWHDIEVEDDVTAYLEYPNGATGAFITSTADSPGTNRFEILGTRGKLVCERDKLTIHLLAEDERVFIKTSQNAFREPECTVTEVPISGQNTQHVGIINNFANAVLGIEPLFVDGKEGLNGVVLMDAMLLSTWLDKTVTLPFDDDLYLSELNKRIAVSKKKSVKDIIIDNTSSFGGTR
ncbi:MAG: Gfo/Idh/MocA family oxidoreductase, partial [Clostridiales bacterium]|nr:Gfo/Idh/MocA family oxidoreductase [Clostridiales bacterium]